MFTDGNVKQFDFKLRADCWEALQIYSYDTDGEFQTEGALTLKVFADSASGIRGRPTELNNLSHDVRAELGDSKYVLIFDPYL